MSRTDVVVIGAGQAGLAMSRELSSLGIEHVILERGRVAERWRTTTWDSFSLLTPNWMTRLPDWRYRGPDQDGFMGREELIRFLASYAGASSAPIIEQSEVRQVIGGPAGYVVETTAGAWRCRAVVIATGHCDLPRLPDFAGRLGQEVTQVHTSQYRNPDLLPAGAVLVVGASASGAQIADELARHGRRVTLSVGRHAPLPRRYRGRDIFWWLDRTGKLSEPVSAMPDVEAVHRQPSLQLVGRSDGRGIDLGSLQARGVRLIGHMSDVDSGVAHFATDLAETIAHASQKRAGVLAEIDVLAEQLAAAADEDEFAPASSDPQPDRLDLRDEGIGAVVWATGFRRNFDWLHVPVVGSDGELLHTGGVTAAAGIYALGYRLLRRRNSNFIDGVGSDAAILAERIADQLGLHLRRAA